MADQRYRCPSPGWLVLAVVYLLAGCAGGTHYRADLDSLQPLETDSLRITPADALAQTSTPDLLELSPEMREFADRYVLTGRSQRQRLKLLQRTLLSPALAGIDYDGDGDGTAAEVFEARRANCLSYAHLFVSMARYAGLNARYHAMELRPDWSRHGDRVARRQHVNVLVELRNGEQFLVDIDPVARTAVARTKVIPDSEAFALYHNNVAMQALLHEDLPTAYAEATRSLALSTDTAYLWVNMGTIYRRAGQDDAAESSYQTALRLDEDSGSAMNNLAVLYKYTGRDDQAVYWEDQVAGYRERNPYYHSFLGLEAARAGNYQEATRHYLNAIDLKEEDADFYYQLGRIYFELSEPENSIRYLEMAIERAHLRADRDTYKAFLAHVTEQQLASR